MVARTFLRGLGTALVLVGILLVAWGFVVWRWGDPLTGGYTWWRQRELADAYVRLAEQYGPPTRAVAATPRARRDEVRAAARRLRLGTGRGRPIGRLRIDRLSLSMVVVNGTDAESLRSGPGRDLRTFMPGEGKLVYIAGHRTTFGAPFAHIDRLRRGDAVVLEMPYGRFAYRVRDSVVVPADDIGRLRSRGREEVALQACHPRFSARERLIVYAVPRAQPQGVAR